jgi:hypothetical protein
MEGSGAIVGPELARGEVRTITFGIGVGNRVGLGLSWPQWLTHIEGQPGHSGVEQVRAKLLLIRSWDHRLTVGLHGGHSWGERFAYGEPILDNATQLFRQDTVQNDGVRTWDLALPVEYRFSRRYANDRVSGYLGPRVIHVDYHDRVRPDGTFNSNIPGAVAGLHLTGEIYDIFVEGTAGYVSRRLWGGNAVGGRFTLQPAVGMSIRLGQASDWVFRRR